MKDRVSFGENYDLAGWYFVLGITLVPDVGTHKWSLGFEFGFWHIVIGIGDKSGIK
jgi:hypothetical protein